MCAEGVVVVSLHLSETPERKRKPPGTQMYQSKARPGTQTPERCNKHIAGTQNAERTPERKSAKPERMDANTNNATRAPERNRKRNATAQNADAQNAHAQNAKRPEGKRNWNANAKTRTQPERKRRTPERNRNANATGTQTQPERRTQGTRNARNANAKTQNANAQNARTDRAKVVLQNRHVLATVNYNCRSIAEI